MALPGPGPQICFLKTVCEAILGKRIQQKAPQSAKAPPLCLGLKQDAYISPEWSSHKPPSMQESLEEANLWSAVRRDGGGVAGNRVQNHYLKTKDKNRTVGSHWFRGPVTAGLSPGVTFKGADLGLIEERGRTIRERSEDILPHQGSSLGCHFPVPTSLVFFDKRQQ